MIISETQVALLRKPDDGRGESEAVLSLELIRRVLELPNEARAMMLAFFHGVDDQSVVGDLQVGEDGSLSLMLVKAAAAPEGLPPDADNVVVLHR